MDNGNSRLIFFLDLVVMYAAFYGIYYHYNGHAMIPFKAMLLMGFVALMWFFICINSNIVRIDRRSSAILALRDVIVGYSVLSAGVVSVVAIFGEFRPNDKLILYPLLFSVILSTIFRVSYLFYYKAFDKKRVSAEIGSTDRWQPGGGKGYESDFDFSGIWFSSTRDPIR